MCYKETLSYELQSRKHCPNFHLTSSNYIRKYRVLKAITLKNKKPVLDWKYINCAHLLGGIFVLLRIWCGLKSILYRYENAQHLTAIYKEATSSWIQSDYSIYDVHVGGDCDGRPHMQTSRLNTKSFCCCMEDICHIWLHKTLVQP